jgi:hypothetical protein
MDHPVQPQQHVLVEKIRSPVQCLGDKDNTLLLRACANSPLDSGPNWATSCVIYLHGFPDLSVHPTTHEFTSRMPRKIAEYVLESVPNGVFVCFNYSGIVGSDAELPFRSKTVSQEVWATVRL